MEYYIGILCPLLSSIFKRLAYNLRKTGVKSSTISSNFLELCLYN